MKALNAEGLPIGPGYPHPLYKQPIFRKPLGGQDYTKLHCPVSEDLCYRSALWFRHSILLGTEDDMTQIAAMFAKIKEHAESLSG